MGITEIGTKVYTEGVVQEVGEIQLVASRGPPGKPRVAVRQLTLADKGFSMTLSLWGPLAALSTHDDLKGRIISVREALVREYQGIKNLSLSPPGSYLIKGPEIKAVGKQAKTEAQGMEIELATIPPQVSLKAFSCRQA